MEFETLGSPEALFATYAVSTSRQSIVVIGVRNVRGHVEISGGEPKQRNRLPDALGRITTRQPTHRRELRVKRRRSVASSDGRIALRCSQ